jgi:hypothetical protein
MERRAKQNSKSSCPDDFKMNACIAGVANKDKTPALKTRMKGVGEAMTMRRNFKEGL